MILQFEVDDEVGRKIQGFMQSGRQGRLVIEFHRREITHAEITDVLLMGARGVSTRTFLPAATGVMVYRT